MKRNELGGFATKQEDRRVLCNGMEASVELFGNLMKSVVEMSDQNIFKHSHNSMSWSKDLWTSKNYKSVFAVYSSFFAARGANGLDGK